MAIKDVEDLRIYQLALELLPRVYRLTTIVEREDRENGKNLRKTAAQIAPVIAEGFAKKQSVAEFTRYLGMAVGSSDEIVTHLKQTKLICKFVDTSECDFLIEEYRSLSRQIMVTIQLSDGPNPSSDYLTSVLWTVADG